MSRFGGLDCVALQYVAMGRLPKLAVGSLLREFS
jgi:hypothetical protein